MSKRTKWTEDTMRIALEEVHNGQPVLAVAKQYGIPRRTLRNHIITGRIHRQLGRHSLLNVAEENELCRRIFRLAEVGMPLTPKVLRRSVFTFTCLDQRRSVIQCQSPMPKERSIKAKRPGGSENGKSRAQKEFWYCFVRNTDTVLDMRRCAACGNYVHEECVGLTKDDTQPFLCPRCSSQVL
ncbi:zinc finger fyve/phd-type [Holotrichia oblita]|uniref:Zinc finger fyve/phd-type n=1 Tax=Holotrichia oblita TaxID=644536 RepID=A0ACB9TBE6_HOLOL|nr:zinc finger fyve/phd-type [Holotrichia oblita]